jgi:hypothetical protein
VGLSLGARGLYVYRKPTRPDVNVVAVDLSLRASLSLVQDHELVVRLRDLFGRDELTTIDGVFLDDPVFPYVGVATNDETLTRDELVEPRLQAPRRGGGGGVSHQEVVWRRASGTGQAPWWSTPAALRVVIGYRFRADRLLAPADSLLAAERPAEAGWTRRGSVFGGLVWDARDREWSPRWGGYHELIGEVANPGLGASSAWTRVSLKVRHYARLGVDQLILAHAAYADASFGDAPLVTLGEFGGVLAVDGIGGRDVGRGYWRRRFIAPLKLHTALELRAEPVRIPIGRRSLTPGLKAFVDVGRATRAGRPFAADWQPAAGPGVYAVWDDFLVLRADVGFTPEGWGLYVTTGHAF